MNAIDDFYDKIKEVDILIEYSKHNQKDVIRYQLFNKIAEVLLTTKFECFIEAFFEEHAERMLRGHTPNTIPIVIKHNYIDHAANQIIGTNKRKMKDTALAGLMALFDKTQTNLVNAKSIQPPVKFNYGKHGQKEIETLFKIHGMETFIMCRESQAFLNQYNSCIAIRNNIIHQDASPTLSHQNVAEHKNIVIDFIAHLKREIEENKLLYYNE